MEKTHQKTFLGECGHTYYLNECGAFILNSFTYDKMGFISDWTFIFDDETYTGTDIEDFIVLLTTIKMNYDVKYKSDRSRDMLIIYTDNLYKIYGFLHNYDKDICIFEDYYLIFNKVFQFRDITKFFSKNDIYSINDIYDKGNQLLNEIFIPNKKFFLTPTQYVLNKINKNNDSDFAKNIYPKDEYAYDYLMKSYFGGLCVCKYPTVCIDTQLVDQHDRDSAYLFEIMCQKHLCEPIKKVNPKGFQYYIDFEDEYYALMTLNISFSKLSNDLELFKDFYGKKLNDIRKTYTIVVNNTDYKVISILADIESCECLELYVGKKDYLPKYILDVVYDEYIKKSYYKKTNNKNLKVQKKLVLSIYGAMVKKIKKFKKEKDNAFLTPYWGTLIASYARYNLVKAAKQVEKWIYSDTDSIYAIRNDRNLTIFMHINEEFRQKTYIMCNKFGYDFNKLKDLGTFQYENTYKKFQANCKKQYMTTDLNGIFKITASGCTGENDEFAYEFYEDEYGFMQSCIDMGIKKYGHISDDIVEATINGVTYKSNGYYYETESNSQRYFELASYREKFMKE